MNQAPHVSSPPIHGTSSPRPLACPLRIDLPGATYRDTSRVDRREPIVVDDALRQAVLDVLAQT
jgi:hypothetical protein